jgi:hypothetical protein
MRLGGPQSLSGPCGEEDLLFLPAIDPKSSAVPHRYTDWIPSNNQETVFGDFQHFFRIFKVKGLILWSIKPPHGGLQPSCKIWLK